VAVLWRGWWITTAVGFACRFEAGAVVSGGGSDAPLASRDAPHETRVDAQLDARLDAVLDGPACTAIAIAAGQLRAPFVSTPPTIDGDLSDWTTCFVTLDKNNAALVLNAGGETTFPSGRFAIEHDDGHIYFAAQVTGIAPLGSAVPPLIYENNAIELYVAGNGMFTGSGYDTDTLQIDIDHADRVQSYSVGNMATTTDLTSAAMLANDGVTYTIEASVEPATFGLASFGSAIGFDFAIDDGSGTSQLSSLIWYAGCGSGSCSGTTCSQPYCDEREFGTTTLAP
jgi:hypothetical protein